MSLFENLENLEILKSWNLKNESYYYLWNLEILKTKASDKTRAEQCTGTVQSNFE